MFINYILINDIILWVWDSYLNVINQIYIAFNLLQWCFSEPITIFSAMNVLKTDL